MRCIKKYKDLLLLIAVYIALIALSVCFLYYVSDTSEKNKKEAERWANIQAVYREQLVDAEKTANIDSLVNIIRCNQIYILDRQADLINDLRQETNNNIDKLSLWLAYALGLISTFGVFIPIVVQYVKNKDFESKFNDLSQNVNNELKDFVEEKNSTLKRIDNDINEKLKNLDEEICRINDNRELIEMRSAFLTLSSGIQQKLINNQPERERLLHYLWKNAIDAFSKVVILSFKEENIEKRRKYLTECLIQIFRSINELKNIGISKRTRKLDKALDDIRYLIYQSDYGYTNDSVWRQIQDNLNIFIKDMTQSNFFSHKL